MEFNMKKEAGFTTNLPYGELHIAGDEEYGFRPYQANGIVHCCLQRRRVKKDSREKNRFFRFTHPS